MYDILFDRVKVGTAEMFKEGLYYKIICTCRPANEGIHRILVSDGSESRDLGICVPEGGLFKLTARVPMKYLKGERLSFCLVGNCVPVPVATGEPFPHLDKLETARLQVTNGQPMIVIDQFQDQQDSDQNQECQNRSE